MVFVRHAIIMLVLCCFFSTITFGMDSDFWLHRGSDAPSQAAPPSVQTVPTVLQAPSSGAESSGAEPVVAESSAQGPSWRQLMGDILVALIVGDINTAQHEASSILSEPVDPGSSLEGRVVHAAGVRVAQAGSDRLMEWAARSLGHLLLSAGTLMGLDKLQVLSNAAWVRSVRRFISGERFASPVLRFGIPGVGAGAFGFGTGLVLRSQASLPFKVVSTVAGLGLVANCLQTVHDRHHALPILHDTQAASLDALVGTDPNNLAEEIISDINLSRYSQYNVLCKDGSLALEGNASYEQKLNFVRALATRAQAALLVVNMRDLLSYAGTRGSHNFAYFTSCVQQYVQEFSKVIVCLDEFDKVPYDIHQPLWEQLFSIIEGINHDRSREVLFVGLVDAHIHVDSGILRRDKYFTNRVMVDACPGGRLTLYHRNMFERALSSATSTGAGIFPFARVSIPESFEDLFGLHNDIGVLRQRIGRLVENPGNDPIGGVILYGPAGTGKSTIGTLLAAEHNLPFCNATGFFKGISEMSSTEAGKQLAALFEAAHTVADAEGKPAIIFVDDVDDLLRDASSPISSADVRAGEYDKLRQFQEKLRTVLDSPQTKHGMRKIIFVVTTNVGSEKFDTRLARAGRFNWIISCALPNDDVRRAFIQKWLSVHGKSMSDEQLARVVGASADKSIPDVRQMLNASP